MPFTCRFDLFCDPAWKTRRLDVEHFAETSRAIRIVSDGRGAWRTSEGGALPALDGCFDVDLAVTPFTNTLPIRRLGLGVGEAAEIDVAYVAFPELDVRRVRQRYTRLAQDVYRYDGLFRGFAADLRVDGNGLVFDYPDTFRRVFPRPADSSA